MCLKPHISTLNYALSLCSTYWVNPPLLPLALLLCLLPFKSLSQAYRQPKPFLLFRIKLHLRHWHYNFPSLPGNPLQMMHWDLSFPSRYPHPTASARGCYHQVRHPALSIVRHCAAVFRELFQLSSNPTPCLLKLTMQVIQILLTKTESYPHLALLTNTHPRNSVATTRSLSIYFSKLWLSWNSSLSQQLQFICSIIQHSTALKTSFWCCFPANGIMRNNKQVLLNTDPKQQEYKTTRNEAIK